MPTPAIRSATPADAAALAAFEAACFPACDRFPARTWRHLLGTASRRGTALVRVVGEPAPLAAIVWLLRRRARVARLYSLAVAPAARGRGLARLLLADAIARLPRRCQVVSLEVRAANQPALGLYAALGFVQCARLPRYYGDGATGVRMRAPRALVAAALARPPVRP